MIYLILGMAITVFAIRFLPISLAGHYRMPEGIARALSFAPPVALSAIVVTNVSGMLKENSSSQHLLAIFLSLTISLGTTRFSQKTLLPICAGILVYMILK